MQRFFQCQHLHFTCLNATWSPAATKPATPPAPTPPAKAPCCVTSPVTITQSVCLIVKCSRIISQSVQIDASHAAFMGVSFVSTPPLAQSQRKKKRHRAKLPIGSIRSAPRRQSEFSWRMHVPCDLIAANSPHSMTCKSIQQSVGQCVSAARQSARPWWGAFQ